MISFFRTMFDSWIGRTIALAFVVLIGFAFALADVSGTLGGATTGGEAVADVGNLEIPASDYSVAVETDLSRIRERNPNLDTATFLAQGGGEAVMERLLASYALTAFANDHGITVSKAMIDSEIAKLPPAQGVDGKFDSAAYNQFLADRGLSDEQLRQDIARTFIAEQLLPTASFGAAPPAKTVKSYAEISFEKRSGEIVPLPSVLFAPEKGPSDAQLKKFYTDEADRFTIPERRAVNYSFFTPDLADGRAAATDEEIAAYYDENKDEFKAATTVRFDQIILPTKEAADQVIKRASAGETLSSIANALGFTVSKESADSEQELAAKSTAAVASAIYAAGKGELSKPAEGEFGFVVARITDVEQRPAKSLAEARDIIKPLVEREKKAEIFAQITEDMQDRLDDGESLADVAKSYKLKVETTPLVLRGGAAPDDPGYKIAETVKPLLGEAFEMEPDDPARVVEAGSDRYALIAVKDVAAAAPPPLAKVRESIIAAWKIDKGEAAARKAGNQALEKIRSGSSLTEAIRAINKRLPPPQMISGTRQEIAQQGERVPPALFALFQIPEDGARLVPVGQERGFLLIRVTDVTPAKLADDDERLPSFTQQYRAALEQELQRQFVAAIQKEVGVEIHEDVRDTVIERLGGNG